MLFLRRLRRSPRWVRRLELRSPIWCHDWTRMQQEQRDREMPWLKYRY